MNANRHKWFIMLSSQLMMEISHKYVFMIHFILVLDLQNNEVVY